MIAVVSMALALLFVVTASGKLTGHATSVELREHHGVSEKGWRQLGVLELLGAIGVLLGLVEPALGVAAAFGLAVLSIGAIAAHIREGDSPVRFAPAVLALVLSAVVVALHVVG